MTGSRTSSEWDLLALSAKLCLRTVSLCRGHRLHDPEVLTHPCCRREGGMRKPSDKPVYSLRKGICIGLMSATATAEETPRWLVLLLLMVVTRWGEVHVHGCRKSAMGDRAYPIL